MTYNGQTGLINRRGFLPDEDTITIDINNNLVVKDNSLLNKHINSSAGISLDKDAPGYQLSLIAKNSPSGVGTTTFSNLSGQKIYLIVHAVSFNAINNTNLYLQFNNDVTGTYWYAQPNGTISSAQTSLSLMNNSTVNIVQSAGFVKIFAFYSTFVNESALVTIKNSRGKTTAGEGSFSESGGWAPASQTEITSITFGTGAGVMTGTVWLFEAVGMT